MEIICKICKRTKISVPDNDPNPANICSKCIKDSSWFRKNDVVKKVEKPKYETKAFEVPTITKDADEKDEFKDTDFSYQKKKSKRNKKY